MKKICNLKPEDLNCNIFSCYDYDGLSLQELLCQFFTRLNECIDLSNETHDLAEWLTNEGLAQSVARQLATWKEDGTLAKIINEEVFGLLDKRTKTTEHSANIIKDPYINDYRQQLTAGDNTEHYNESTYGKCELSVRNGVGTITGYLNFTETPGPGVDFTLVKPILAMKQIKTIVNTVTGYNKHNYAETAAHMVYLGKNGQVAIDGTIAVAGNNKYRCNDLGLNINFPIVKAYAKQEDKEKIEVLADKVASLETEKSSTIILACDSHIRPTQYEETATIEDSQDLYLPKLMNYVNEKLGAFATINNGDTLTEAPNVLTKSDILWSYDSVRKLYNDNTIFVLGNHDDYSIGTIQAQYIIEKEKFNTIMNKGKTGINWSEGNQPYFFTDDTNGMVRHIILNTHDKTGKKIGNFIFGANQMKWLVETLKSTPFGYSIAIYCHVPPIERPGIMTDTVKNAPQLRNILTAYKNRTKGSQSVEGTTVNYDFTNCEALIAGVFSGHEHKDYNTTEGGIHYIVEDAAVDNRKYSVVIIDGKNRKIKDLRQGSGRSDLILSY